MSNKEMFDKWFNALSKQEQDEIIKHIISNKLSVSNEGLFAGPTGKTLEKGLFSGPAGNSSKQVCRGCGRPI
jgi:hypothetical protein